VSWDYVIVGGGSAGCALAARLTEDASTRVLVLEAGRPDSWWDLYIHMPAALSFPIGSRFYDWKYESEPEPNLNNRRIYHARGKVLGGSSSINGMIFQRGNPLDYERWADDDGMESWDYAHCLPYFKRMETCLAGADAYRGAGGPLVLERGPAWSEPDLVPREADGSARLFWDRGLAATEDLGVVLFAGRALGGGTVVNWMTSLRLPDRHPRGVGGARRGRHGRRPRPALRRGRGAHRGEHR